MSNGGVPEVRLESRPLAVQVLAAWPDARWRGDPTDLMPALEHYAERIGISTRQATRDFAAVWSGAVTVTVADRMATWLDLHLALIYPELYRTEEEVA